MNKLLTALRFERSALLFSFNSFAAAMLALYVGFSIGLPRPYWAMMTAYIVSHPLAGAVRSKAIFRLCGTLVGTTVALLLVPPLVDSPVLLCLAIALWIGACLFISLLDRTPRSYVLMLAGYTAAIIAFPSVNTPDLIFDVAIARFEEISIGIVCATVVHSIIFPRPVGGPLVARLTSWLGSADQWALDVLHGRSAAETDRERRQLAAAETEIHLLSKHLPFDTSNLREITNVVHALHTRTLVLIPIIDGLNDRLSALRADSHALSPAVARLIDAVAAWISGGADRDQADPLLTELKSVAAATPHDADWATLLSVSLLTRLVDLVETLGDSHTLLDHVRRGKPLSAELAEQVGSREHRPLHRDYGMALRSAAAASIAVLLCCALWIMSGWRDGAAAAMIAAVVCCFFATMDDPKPTIASFGIFNLVALPIAAVFQFTVMPQVSDFPMLVLVLAPILLPMGVYMAAPRTLVPAMAMITGFCNALALQETLSHQDFADFMNVNTAMFVGVLIALWVTGFMRSISVETSARRLLHHNWRDLAHHARAGAAAEPIALAGRLLDRLTLLTPKLAAVSQSGALRGVDVLHDLRIGMNLVNLQKASPGFEATTRDLTERALAGVGEHYSQRSAGGLAEAPARLLADIDHALHAIAEEPPSTAKLAGLSAMVGLRGNLFPKAAAYQAAGPLSMKGPST